MLPLLQRAIDIKSKRRKRSGPFKDLLCRMCLPHTERGEEFVRQRVDELVLWYQS